MTFFVISDIHGSALTLEKALNIYNKGDYNKLIICGDILYHGARNPIPEGYSPVDVTAMLNNIKNEIIVVRGNCESEVDQMVLEFPIMSDYTQVFADQLDIFVTHGHIFSPENLPPIPEKSIFFSGHTHIPTADIIDNMYCFNPGSITMPKGGFEASFGILTPNTWEVRGLDSNSVIMSRNIKDN
jgi:uncharacterized protein